MTEKQGVIDATKKYHLARAKGLAAGRIGTSVLDCPYSTKKEATLARIWVAGHREGRDERRIAREKGGDITKPRRAKHAMG